MSLLKSLENILKDIVFESIDKYYLQGCLYTLGHESEVNDKKNERHANALFIQHLSEMIYKNYHCKYVPYNGNTYRSFAYHLHRQDFIDALSSANSGNGTWEAGWEIKKVVGNTQLKVFKERLSLWLTQDEFFPYDGVYAVGKSGYIRIPKEFRELMSGFYSAVGNEPIYQKKYDLPTIRFYWNITAEYAVYLMKLVTEELNSLNIPFFFKVLNNPISFSRTDAAVLYVNKYYIDRCLDGISKIYKQIQNFLNPSTSIFTRKIASGFALAEELDIKKHESFGQNRSRILAESIYYSYKEAHDINSNIYSKVKEIIFYLYKQGIDIEHPYLNPHSYDDYDSVVKRIREYKID